MAKFDDLKTSLGGNIAESMGARPGGMVPREPAASARGAPDRMAGVGRAKNAAEIPVDRIGPDPDQPRDEFEPEALERLAASLRARGQLQPIRVRWDEAGARYTIICGERRWRAAGMAGMATIQAIISEAPADPGELLAMQMVENCMREDLRPIEQARAFRQLIDANGWTVRRVADELGIGHAGVVKSLAMLDLPTPVQERVEAGDISPSVAYEVSKLATPEAQAEVADLAVAGKLNRAEVVEVVRGKSAKPGKGRGAKAKKAKRTVEVFRTASGLRVTVENRRGLDNHAILEALKDAIVIAMDRCEADERAA